MLLQQEMDDRIRRFSKKKGINLRQGIYSLTFLFCGYFDMFNATEWKRDSLCFALQRSLPFLWHSSQNERPKLNRINNYIHRAAPLTINWFCFVQLLFILLFSCSFFLFLFFFFVPVITGENVGANYYHL